MIMAIIGFLALSGSSSKTDSKTSNGVTRKSVAQADVVTTSASSKAPGQEFVAQLLAIQNIKLNLDMFKDPVFRGLQNFSQPLKEQPIARKNPFAPIDLNALSVSAGSEEDASLSSQIENPSASAATVNTSVKGAATTKAPVKTTSSSKTTTKAGSIFQAVPSN